MTWVGQWVQVALSKRLSKVGLPHLTWKENRSIFRYVVFSNSFEFRTMDKVHKHGDSRRMFSAILSERAKMITSCVKAAKVFCYSYHVPSLRFLLTLFLHGWLFTLTMEAIRSSESWVLTRAIPRHIPDDAILQISSDFCLYSFLAWSVNDMWLLWPRSRALELLNSFNWRQLTKDTKCKGSTC
jgi:hypothetical protein